jgi:hypothetical protein
VAPGPRPVWGEAQLDVNPPDGGRENPALAAPARRRPA